ncbi:MAG: hypothetical protein N2Z74_02670, partial [Syntrophales bacterium]|nr:hypothetical protein [Syntrophales bacterium]
NYTIGGVAQVGTTVRFTTSRGTLSADTAVTDGSGNATVNISSKTVGPTTIQASVDSGPTVQRSIEFVSTTPATMTLQADPAVIETNPAGSTNQTSNIIAVVRDAEDNLVKGQIIDFTVENDLSGGYVSPISATTDSYGRAVINYIAGAAPSGKDGVTIKATIRGKAISATTYLTVAKKNLYITLGNRGKLAEVDPSLYGESFGALVTDAAGNPVPGVTVTATAIPVGYMKGNYTWCGTCDPKTWVINETLAASRTPGSYPWPQTSYKYCSNEDLYYYKDPTHPTYALNGILDGDEDKVGAGGNANGRLDPGNVAAITGSATTDANGVATFTLLYQKRYATWVIVRIEVRAAVAGSEGAAFMVYRLPALGSDLTSTSTPAFIVSPFGESTICNDDK